MVFVFLIVSRSIHIIANGIISFFDGWVIFHYIYVRVFVCVYIYIYIFFFTHTHTHPPHIFFIHSSVYGYLGCFYALAIVSSAAMNM